MNAIYEADGIRFRHHLVHELVWALGGPGILSPEVFPEEIFTDSEAHRFLKPFLSKRIAELDLDPTPLLNFLSLHPDGGRLGRHFENLLHYFFTEVAAVEKCVLNLQIRGKNERGKNQTIGELDLVMRETAGSTPLHLEASVKFYICLTPLLEKSEINSLPKTHHYLGTLVKDRLDLKIEKLLSRQRRLTENQAAKELLAKVDLAEPRSLGLLKGTFFYSSATDWRNCPSAIELSRDHHRGWWTTASDPQGVPRSHPESNYIHLRQIQWLAPFHGRVARHDLLSFEELRARKNRLFDSSLARPRHFEMLVAEVLPVAPDAGSDDWVWVRELSRGTILHDCWPAYAVLAGPP